MDDVPGEDADAADDVPADVPDGSDADASDDVGADTGEDVAVTPLEVPFIPDAVAEPIVDEPFLQEWNHTTPEVDPRIGPLVDVVLPPSGYEAWTSPIQVTPRGVVRDTGDVLDVVEIPEEAMSDLIGAGTSPGALVLASATTAYLVSADGTLTEQPAPDGTLIERVTDGLTGVWASDVDRGRAGRGRRGVLGSGWSARGCHRGGR